MPKCPQGDSPEGDGVFSPQGSGGFRGNDGEIKNLCRSNGVQWRHTVPANCSVSEYNL